MSEHHIYIHFPYCLYKCHYCDFNSHAWEKSQIPHENYTEALLKEVKLRREIFEKSGTHFFLPQTKISSVFFGGGTPSLMMPSDVEILLKNLATEFDFSDDVEITLECNPGTVDRTKFLEFKSAGINRVSLGIQSLNEKYLAAFGRIHSGDAAIKALQAAVEAGFSEISADLIFGFPGQSLSEWQTDLEKILEFPLRHVSCYALTAEAGTEYFQALRKGVIQETQSEIFHDMMKWTYDRMEMAQMPAYEISNFSARGHKSRHNLGYWHYEDYIGLGAGAWGNYHVLKPEDFIIRSENYRSPQHYMQALKAGTFFHEEIISKKKAMFEFMMMGLRLSEGVAAARFQELFSESIFQVYRLPIEQCEMRNWITVENGILKPTQAGMFFNNEMVQEFLLPS